LIEPQREGRVLRVGYDPEADSVFRLDESPVVESEEIRPGVVLDLDERGEIIGIEMLRVSQRLPKAELKRMEFDLV
jgi:uncharacterized protein YuzE